MFFHDCSTPCNHMLMVSPKICGELSCAKCISSPMSSISKFEKLSLAQITSAMVVINPGTEYNNNLGNVDLVNFFVYCSISLSTLPLPSPLGNSRKYWIIGLFVPFFLNG